MNDQDKPEAIEDTHLDDVQGAGGIVIRKRIDQSSPLLATGAPGDDDSEGTVKWVDKSSPI